MTERTLYEVLMVQPTATPEVINAVYRVLAKQHHPDHAGPEGARQMAQINEAHATLSDATKRARYDESLVAKSAPAWTTVSTPTAPRAAPTAPKATPTASSAWYGRESAPGATNLKYEDGAWSVRPPSEPSPPAPTYGEAGPPPAHLPARGSVLSFGRYRGWSVSQVAQHDRDYVEWLSRTMAGRSYRNEMLQALGQSVSHA